MRSALILPLLLSFASAGASAQQGETSQPTLSVRSTLVEVPSLVKTKAGEVVFELTADDFVLTDDGVPQHLTLDPDTDWQPLALASSRAMASCESRLPATKPPPWQYTKPESIGSAKIALLAVSAAAAAAATVAVAEALRCSGV